MFNLTKWLAKKRQERQMIKRMKSAVVYWRTTSGSGGLTSLFDAVHFSMVGTRCLYIRFNPSKVDEEKKEVK